MSVENVPAVVNIKTLKGRFIANKFSTGWAVGTVKGVEKKKSGTGQFAVKYVVITGLTSTVYFLLLKKSQHC